MERQKGVLKKKWVSQMVESIRRMHPDRPISTIEKFVEKLYEKRLKDKECELHNNYENVNYRTKMTDLIDWIETTKPVCAGYGVFYHNQENALNPNARMLEHLMDERASLKKQLKTLDPTSYLYQETDRGQDSKKRASNAFYGVSLSPVSAFYNRYVGVSITASGQSLLSTTETAFEAFIAGSFQFYEFSDFMYYVNTVLEDPLSEEYPLDDIGEVELYRWLAPRMKNRTAEIDNRVAQFIHHLSQQERNRLYYVNNIFEVIRHPFMEKLLVDIFQKTEVFKDAGNVPEEIALLLETLWSIIHDTVFFKGFFFDRIYRFKEDERQAVVLCDTDSDMMSVDRWVVYMKKHIAPKTHHDPNTDNTNYIAVSMKAYLLTAMIRKTLLNYTRSVNILDSYSPRINMKNEYLFSRIALAATKKRYVCFQKLREGKEFPVPKFDAKGVDFLKSTTREATRDFLEDICKKDILVGDVDVSHVRNRLKELEETIRTSLQNGEKDYLTPANVKEIGGYKKPYQMMGLLGVLAWNNFNPDNTIELPDIVDILKVRLDQKPVIALLAENHPEQYEIFKKHYIHPSIPELKDKYVNAIAIPRATPVPEWILPYIDYDTIVRDNISRFNSVRESLDIVEIKVKGGVTEYSNILNI